jgi:MbtH protein
MNTSGYVTGEGLAPQKAKVIMADPDIFNVVKNDEDQYSIWWVDRDLPAGWDTCGKSGTKDECLAYIDEVWTDMRPRSLRLGTQSSEAD